MSRQTLPLSVRVGVQTLRANPMRTVLSTLGVVMGAASLVAVLSLGDGAERFAREQIERRGMQTVAILAKTSDTVDGLQVPRADYPRFTPADLQDLAAFVSPDTEVLLSVEGTGMLTVDGKPRAALLQGLDAGNARQMGLHLWRGRLFTPDELASGTPVAIVGYKLAAELSARRPTESVIGDELAFGGGRVRVIGIQQSVAGERLLSAVVPLAQAERLMVPVQAARVRALALSAPRVEDVLATKAQAESWADRRNPDWRGKGQVTIASTGLDRLVAMNQGILVFKILMGAFTAISLIVGGIGIMNVLLASVAERTKEIGVRKAAGARRRDIVVQFLAESVVISLAGAAMGAVLGIAGAYLVTWIMRWQTMAQVYAAVTWPTLAVAMGAAILVGLVFGTYPALKAANLSPVEAMRYE
ncbi:MAG: ABC transporter permease [Rhodospirillaceae bacterium]